jgi:hypothetical protein
VAVAGAVAGDLVVAADLAAVAAAVASTFAG